MTQPPSEPEPPADAGARLGDILVNAGFVSREVIAEALAEQKEKGLPLGQILVESGYVPGHRIAMALADQSGGPVRTEYGFATGHTPSAQLARMADLAPETPPVDPTVERVTPLSVIEQAPDARLAPEPYPVPVTAPAGEALADERTRREAAEAALARTMIAADEIRELLANEQSEHERSKSALAPLRAELDATAKALAEVRQALTGERTRREEAEAAAEQATIAVDEIRELLANERLTHDQSQSALAPLRAELERATHTAHELAQLLATERAAREDAQRASLELQATIAEQKALLEDERRDPRAYGFDQHVLFVPGPSYRLVERAGPPPVPGMELELDGQCYTVLRLGPALLPGNRIACAYLEATAPPPRS